jgi:antirestriction protein ArdC
MARMTNVEIVTFQWAQLVAAGMISESEEIHTFQKWKSLGYTVKRGEKAVASFTIWKHTTKTDKESGEETARMFMKKAHFFSTKQVEKIQPVKRVSAAEMVGKKVTITIGR